jgi:hypothetical protein
MGKIKEWWIDLVENHIVIEQFISEYGGEHVMRAFDEAILAQDIDRIRNALKDALGMATTRTHMGYEVINRLTKENPHGGPSSIYTH